MIRILAPRRSASAVRKLNVPNPVIIVLVLVAAMLIWGYSLGAEERAYSGTATVVKADSKKRLCTVDVKTPQGAEYDFTFRSTHAQGTNDCHYITPGTIITIREGRILIPQE